MGSSREPSLGALDMMPLLVERLAAGQKVRGLQFSGISMLPMLRQGRDTVEISQVPEQLHKYDLPVYLGPNGKYVMHRIVRVEADCFVCLGDNTYSFERVKRDQIVAFVSAFTRGNRRVSVTHPAYRLYARVWVAVIPLRRLLKRVQFWLRRHMK